MKKILTYLFYFWAFCAVCNIFIFITRVAQGESWRDALMNHSVQPAQSTKQIPQEEPAIPKKPMFIQRLCASGNDYYFNVTGLDKKDVQCSRVLREYCANNEEFIETIKPCTLHFLDNCPNFTPPSDGMYGSASVRNRVILQYICFADKRNLEFDPMGTGKYRF
jgi:hypothetical protein